MKSERHRALVIWLLAGLVLSATCLAIAETEPRERGKSRIFSNDPEARPFIEALARIDREAAGLPPVDWLLGAGRSAPDPENPEMVILSFLSLDGLARHVIAFEQSQESNEVTWIGDIATYDSPERGIRKIRFLAKPDSEDASSIRFLAEVDDGLEERPIPVEQARAIVTRWKTLQSEHQQAEGIVLAPGYTGSVVVIYDTHTRDARPTSGGQFRFHAAHDGVVTIADGRAEYSRPIFFFLRSDLDFDDAISRLNRGNPGEEIGLEVAPKSTKGIATTKPAVHGHGRLYTSLTEEGEFRWRRYHVGTSWPEGVETEMRRMFSRATGTKLLVR